MAMVEGGWLWCRVCGWLWWREGGVEWPMINDCGGWLWWREGGRVWLGRKDLPSVLPPSTQSFLQTDC